MYVKSIIIDGFKSYAQRTEVNGFDPLFNAITGLNGSGKSNILDSICFVLGISNLGQVRATNLQELVYKNGQAGVTKATVSITFDNSDGKQSPLGYEQYNEITVTRQVVVGGRNKYLINGSNANNTRVQDLFRSVQLNINNPHFLIMQGRITKVLNMKPPEILSMIEEAAGTRLYESKKEAAQKTIEKKDAKLREIDTILKEEITPTLSRLKEERSSYLEYQKVIRELEHLNKLYIAYKFVCAEETKQHSAQELVEMQETINNIEKRRVDIAGKVAELNKVIEELQRKRDQEAGGTMERLTEQLKEEQKRETKATSDVNHKKEALKAEQKKMKELQKHHTSDEASLKSKRKEIEKLEGAFKKLQEQSDADQLAHSEAQKHFHAVSAGLSTNKDGADASLNDQLIDAKKKISNAETDAKQAQMRLKHSSQEIKKKQGDLKKTEQGYKKDEETHKAIVKNIDRLKSEMAKLGYEDGDEERLQQRRRDLTQEVHILRNKVDDITAHCHNLKWSYKDPGKTVDSKSVKGLVAKLISLHDPKHAVAIQITAGNKLFQVVVDTDLTGSKLLNKNKVELSRRSTFIPLNKTAGRAITPEIIKKAESIVGKNNVQLALSLVGCEKDVEIAIKYVFGQTLVCSDMNTAREVAFARSVEKRTVTLDGDSFDPSGSLTGGSKSKDSGILLKLAELKETEEALHGASQALAKVEGDLANLRKVAESHRRLKQNLDLKQHEAQLLEEKLQQSTHGQQLEEIKTLQTTIEENEEILANAKETEKTATDKMKELENKLKNAKATREAELKAAEAEVTKAKKKMEDSSKKMKEKREEVAGLQLEVEELEKELASYGEQMEAVETATKGYQEQIAQLQEEAQAVKEAVKAAQAEVNKQKELLKACNSDISARTGEQKDLHKEDNAAQLKLQESQHKVDKCNKDSRDAAKQVEDYLQRYEWIADEKKYFGQANTAYDFEANDPKEAAKRIQKLTETKDKLSKNVNMRAMNMLGKAEEQYNDLMKKRDIVLKDKAKIMTVIAELDEKKKEALLKAHTQVNKDFGSIFSTLLPGTQAKLVAPDGQTILDGLEVKVAFGEVWKESLQELSGGQRSLVALSLILSLLLFKPAPLYILDEVDAALDLSHTQNIGQMLRTHFRHSQFIVVSLKDGMFNNANVLFKTKFVDGVSTVTRYTQSQPPLRTDSSSSAASGAGGKGKKKGAGAKRPRLEEGATPLSTSN